jgi:hypothetical protein
MDGAFGQGAPRGRSGIRFEGLINNGLYSIVYKVRRSICCDRFRVKSPIAPAIWALILNPNLRTFCFNTPLSVDGVVVKFSGVLGGVSKNSSCKC